MLNDYRREYRPELPEVPARMRSLPVQRGYPVPWFVAKVAGEYHFPTADARKVVAALEKKLCWCCGQPLGVNKTFVIGPMCAVNRTTSEPPNHFECAVFAAKACPFLVRPKMKRQKEHAPGSSEPPGLYLDRNPGVTLVWTTRRFVIRRIPGEHGFLFRIGPPTSTLWFAEGRYATREEVLVSMASGLPLLAAAAKQDDQPEAALKELDRCYTDALRMVPA